jgi:two-component system phosphate regulon sensor histidine kinase PhoR
MWFLWPIILLVALTGLHLWWRAKFRALQGRRTAEIEASHRKQQQTSLDAQAQQKVLFDSMLEGLLLLDRSRKIHLANRAFKNLFGVKAELRGKTVVEALRLHELDELLQRAENEKQVLDYEIKLPGLVERWLRVNAAAITNAAGQREEFVANVSHELRTPLSLIKGYVETLLDGAKDNPEVAERFLKIIERNANRLDLLIQDLLTISALESGRMKLELSPVDLRALTDKVLTFLHAKAENKNVTLLNELPAFTVNADANRLDQVLANLVDNAIKYGRAEGTVIIGGKKLDDGALEIFVRDNGPGIPPEALDRVFERFYRVDKARSRDQGGTGLGLAIVKHMIQAHGGEVRCESELGKGATFFFTLPAVS